MNSTLRQLTSWKLPVSAFVSVEAFDLFVQPFKPISKRGSACGVHDSGNGYITASFRFLQHVTLLEYADSILILFSCGSSWVSIRCIREPLSCKVFQHGSEADSLTMFSCSIVLNIKQFPDLRGRLLSTWYHVWSSLQGSAKLQVI